MKILFPTKNSIEISQVGKLSSNIELCPSVQLSIEISQVAR